MGNRMMDDIIHRMEGYNVEHMPHDKSMRCTLRDGKTGEMYTFKVRHGEVYLSQRAGALLEVCAWAITTRREMHGEYARFK